MQYTPLNREGKSERLGLRLYVRQSRRDQKDWSSLRYVLYDYGGCSTYFRVYGHYIPDTISTEGPAGGQISWESSRRPPDCPVQIYPSKTR